MPFLTFALDCYFAAVLGIAGLAKMDDPAPFAATLRRQRLLPAWSVDTIGRLFPWLEIAVAGALLSGITAIFVATFTILIFAGFFVSSRRSTAATAAAMVSRPRTASRARASGLRACSPASLVPICGSWRGHRQSIGHGA